MKKQKKRRFSPAFAAAALVFAGSALLLIGYGADYLKQKHDTAELRGVYYSEESAAPESSPAPERIEIADITEDAAAFTEAEESPAPAETAPAVRPTEEPAFLEETGYPDNPKLKVRKKFTALKKTNRDIVGWLTVPDLIDEPVVQRDNKYYLNRDYRGYHSQEGALFLDERVNLKKWPYTLIIYGHNMKSGAKFGFLKRYENKAWAKKHLTLTFDQQYGNGEYVVFAATSFYIGNSIANDSVKLFDLFSMDRAVRQQVIDRLTTLSDFHSPYTACPDDQLLMLVTCNGDSMERFVVAARRVREDEKL